MPGSRISGSEVKADRSLGRSRRQLRRVRAAAAVVVAAAVVLVAVVRALVGMLPRDAEAERPVARLPDRLRLEMPKVARRLAAAVAGAAAVATFRFRWPATHSHEAERGAHPMCR